MKLFIAAMLAISLSGCITAPPPSTTKAEFEAFKSVQDKNWAVMNKYVNANEKKHNETHDSVEALKTYMTENFEQVVSDSATVRDGFGARLEKVEDEVGHTIRVDCMPSGADCAQETTTGTTAS